MKDSKDYDLNYLVAALRDAGITKAKTVLGAKQTISYWIREGVLVLRQSPRSKFRYRVNEEEVKQIISELSPGGKGFWHYDQSTKESLKGGE
jgi:hypothetical protein